MGFPSKLADDDHSAVESHAGGEGRPAEWHAQSGLFTGTLPQLKGRQHSPSGMVLMGDGGTEECHKAVAKLLRERPRIALHHTLHQAEEALHEAIHRFRPDVRGELGGIGQSTTQDSDRLALAFQDIGGGTAALHPRLGFSPKHRRGCYGLIQLFQR